MPIAPIPNNSEPPVAQLRAWLARVAWVLNHRDEHSQEDATGNLSRVWGPLDLVEKDLKTVERITANPPKWLREQLLPQLNATTLPAMVTELTRLLDECKLRGANMKIQVMFGTDSRGYVNVKITEHRDIGGYEPIEYSREDPDALNDLELDDDE